MDTILLKINILNKKLIQNLKTKNNIRYAERKDNYEKLICDQNRKQQYVKRINKQEIIFDVIYI